MRKKRILLVDDDPHILTGVAKDLESEGSENGEQAIAWLEKTFFDVVITDLVMQPMDGIDVLKKAKALNPETKVIVLTGYGGMTSAIDALRLNADDYLLKPCEESSGAWSNWNSTESSSSTKPCCRFAAVARKSETTRAESQGQENGCRWKNMCTPRQAWRLRPPTAPNVPRNSEKSLKVDRLLCCINNMTKGSQIGAVLICPDCRARYGPTRATNSQKRNNKTRQGLTT
jgi:CheY-like chemotaxis protein